MCECKIERCNQSESTLFLVDEDTWVPVKIKYCKTHNEAFGAGIMLKTHEDMSEEEFKRLYYNSPQPKSFEDYVAKIIKRNPEAEGLIKSFQAETARLKEIVDRPRPTIVCLCGSTRFMDAFFAAGWELTLQGQIVLSVGVCKHADSDGAHGAEAAGVAEKLDELHRRKIDLADWVLILNIGGYYGQSTEGEIKYAESLGKPVYFLRNLPRPINPYVGVGIDWDEVCMDTREAAEKAKAGTDEGRPG